MLKMMMIMALAGALAGGVVTSAQARGGGMGHVGGIRIGGGTGMIGMGAGGVRTSPALAFHPRPPGVSHGTGTYCNLNPGYLEHPCF
jgi:hypothetical protein